VQDAVRRGLPLEATKHKVDVEEFREPITHGEEHAMRAFDGFVPIAVERANLAEKGSASGAVIPPSEGRMEDRQIMALTEMVNAVNVGDAKRYAGLYAQDAVITIYGSGELKGRGAIEQHEVELLREFPTAAKQPRCRRLPDASESHGDWQGKDEQGYELGCTPGLRHRVKGFVAVH
jgi:hypothetical protein